MSEVRTYELDLSTFGAGSLSTGDALAIFELVDCAPSDFSGLIKDLSKENEARRLRALLALAWVTARRAEPGLTWEEVSTDWLVTITTPPAAEVGPTSAGELTTPAGNEPS